MTELQTTPAVVLGPHASACDRRVPVEAWLTTPRFALLLALMIVLAFSGVILGNRTFVFRDFGLFSYPVAYFHRQSFWHGEIPLWNPYSQCGLPFLAQWNTMVLYPFSLIYLLLPLTWSLPCFCLAHLFWAGLGMYFLGRHWTGHCLAAAVAGVVFSFNGLTLNFLIWPSHVATFSWVPWLLWLVPEGWRFGGKKLVLAVLVAAMQMLAGGPETIVFTWLVLLVLAITDSIKTETETPRAKVVSRFGLIVFLVTLLCAAQLLPFLQLVGHSQRDAGYGSSGWEMPIWGWANFLVPVFGTTQSPQGVCWQQGQYWTSSYYAGVGTVFLAVVALRRVRNWRVYLLATLIALGLVLALGNRGLLYRGIHNVFPFLGFLRYPVKFVILVLFLAPILAAFGLASLMAGSERLSKFDWAALVGLSAAIALIPLVKWEAAGQGLFVLGNAATRLFFLCTIFALVWACKRPVRFRQTWLGVLLLAVFWLDFLTHVPWQNPTASPDVYSPGWTRMNCRWNPDPSLGRSRAMISPPAFLALKYHNIASPDRTYLLQRIGLLADCNLLEQIPQAHGFFSLAPSQINDVTTVPYVDTNHSYSALLDFMGVSQITAPGASFEWAPRPSALPLVTLGQKPIFADDQTVFTAFADPQLDLRQVVFLPSEAHGQISVTNNIPGPGPGTHLVSSFAAGKVSIETTAPQPSLVVIAQTFYPAWRAYLDGRPTTLWRANLAFQAVEVPAGQHQVELRYRDSAFLSGLVLAGLGVFACIVLLVRADRGTLLESQ